MKVNLTLKNAELDATALRILRSVPDLEVNAASGHGDGHADAVVTYQDQRTPVAIEVKRRVDTATAHHVARNAAGLATPLLVIANETTNEARRVLADAGIAFVDGLGNTHIELPGLILRLTGKPGSTPRRGRATLSGKSGLVAQALLFEPDRRWHVTELVDTTGVSAGLVHRVLTRLEDVGIAAVAGSGPGRTRYVADPTALLDLWVEEQRDDPDRTRGFRLAPTLRQLIDDLDSALDVSGVAYAFTGAAGANLIAPFVTSVPVAEVWIQATASIAHVLEATATTAVDEGHNVVFLQGNNDDALAFRTHIDGVCVTNLFRLYRDLRNDPRRGVEQADHLRKQVIGF